MQLTRLVAVLIAAALPAIASAAECSEANYEKAPDSLVADFDKIADALDKAVTEVANALEARDLRLLERQERDAFVTRQFQCMLLPQPCDALSV